MSGLDRAARGVLLAGFAGPDVPRWLPEELELGLGGVCLYGNNVAPGRDLAELARTVRGLAGTAVLAVDEEGGDVTRLHVTTGSPYAGPAVLGRLDSPSVTRAVATGIGAELAAAGIWLDLAPCADVNSDPLNPVIGTRSFGADPALVARHTVAFVEGLAAAGVAASVKHFPGHGDTRTDSHHAVPTVRAGREVLHERELVPFAAAVRAGAATVMTSHVVIEALDPDRPATFSPVLLQDVLRGELGFEGVVVTDALDMAGAQGDGGMPGAAVRALAAGADLLCLGPGTDEGPLVVRRVARAIAAAVEEGSLPAERLADAADRVGRLRAAWSGPSDPAGPLPAGPLRTGRATTMTSATRATVIAHARQASARAATALLDGIPSLPAARVIHLETGTSPAVGQTAWGLVGADTPRLLPSALAATALPQGPTLLLVRGATSDVRVWRWVRETLTTNPQVWLVELGWPAPELDRFERVIRTYGASAASTTALTRALGWTP
ncbi:glycoside hydrolase family 3 protein [Ornithinimicrobium cavernae]|uniref:glycoside hydrolase family 3 protein n=1 Tax=Ornithinimicrobium cavernae TaxID=2666047 RepID=UPI00137AEFA5|nr:glycoside hydrolase family 3 protein [Ornithinimicrobium cavernae]